VLRAVDDPPVAEIAALNDAAYGYPGSFARAVGPDLANHAFLAGELDGESLVACTVGVHLGDDLHVTMTATRPDHRGRGIASSLVGRVVAAGEAAGATTTSLVATAAGVPIYARLGYRDVGAFEMWERVL
jgi:GNAT superfamily N-acetyltransferase